MFIGVTSSRAKAGIEVFPFFGTHLRKDQFGFGPGPALDPGRAGADVIMMGVEIVGG